MNGLPAAEEMLCIKAADKPCKRGGSVPLLTYENIIPQRGEIVKRLTAVFKKYFGDFFCLGGGTFFTLNVEWVINAFFFLITSTEYIKSV